MRRLLTLITALALAVSACSSSGTQITATPTPPESAPEPEGSDADQTADRDSDEVSANAGVDEVDPAPDYQFIASLTPFSACEAFLSHVRGQAAARVGPYGFDDPGFGGPPIPIEAFVEEDFGGDVAFDEAAEAPAEAGVSTVEVPAAEAGVDFSETNVQVAGVDEPDIIKTDGDRILAVAGGRIHYIDVSGEIPEQRGSVGVGNGFGLEMLVRGDRVLVISQGDGFLVGPQAQTSEIAVPYFATVEVALVDVSDPDALEVTSTMRLEGRYVSARSIDGIARLVVTSPPANIDFVYPQGPGAEDIAETTNRQIIAESALEDWLPVFTIDDVDQGPLVPCERIHRPAEFAGFDSLSVLTIDLDRDLSPVDAVSVLAQGDTVYANEQSLYVATNVFATEQSFDDQQFEVFEERYSTQIHRFELTAAGPAEYSSSGSVRGHLLNQFSMDELDGNLRVATTDGSPFGFRDDAESYVTVLSTSGDELVPVGQVGGLGRGERIFAVRFIGTTGYVVTFRETDPLYVVDLADPTAPAVTGELKIPGYSAYLHPVGDGLILGVGQEATSTGRTIGAKVSLFDVSDPAVPRTIDDYVVEASSTSVEWDHRAFLYWAPEQLAVIPLQDFDDGFSGALALRVDGQNGLDLVGRISHSGTTPTAPGPGQCTPLTAEDFRILGEEVDELLSGELVVQVCEPQQSGGAGPEFFCEAIPLPEVLLEIPSDVDPAAVDSVFGQFSDDARVEVCFQDFAPVTSDPIERTLVVGDDLWSLSASTLQANDLQSLERTTQVRLF